MAFKRNCLGTSASWATQENRAKGLCFVQAYGSGYTQTVPAKKRLQARCYQQRQQPPYVATEGPAA